MADGIGGLEKSVRDQELFYELIVAAFDRLPDGVVVADIEGFIRLVNAKTEELFGYHRTMLIGKKVEALVPEEYRERHAEHRKTFWRDPRPRWMGDGRPLPALTKDGEIFQAQIMLAPIIIEQGRFVVVVLRKIANSDVEKSR
jgi:PAS domain S-box-containing protein